MRKSDEIIAVLDEIKALLEKLAGETVSGFAVIAPPTGEIVKFLMLDSQVDANAEKSFYLTLIDKLNNAKQAMEPWQGGVGTRHSR
jgi:hypothetical protein